MMSAGGRGGPSSQLIRPALTAVNASADKTFIHFIDFLLVYWANYCGWQQQMPTRKGCLNFLYVMNIGVYLCAIREYTS
jgi:hypothetical protein